MKSNHKDHMPKLSEMLCNFIETVEKNPLINIPVTIKSLQQQALKYKKILLADGSNVTKEEKKHLKNFKASVNWAKKWARHRGALVNTLLHGEAGGVNDDAIAEKLVEITQIMTEYDADNIFNVDETGLFYHLLPRRSYVKINNKKDKRGKKGMNSKDRITVYVGTNASGSLLIPLSVIGKAKRPRCFPEKHGS